jgi:hypothetical protein
MRHVIRRKKIEDVCLAQCVASEREDLGKQKTPVLAFHPAPQPVQQQQYATPSQHSAHGSNALPLSLPLVGSGRPGRVGLPVSPGQMWNELFWPLGS